MFRASFTCRFRPTVRHLGSFETRQSGEVSVKVLQSTQNGNELYHFHCVKKIKKHIMPL